MDTKKSVLVVDDEEHALLLYRVILEKEFVVYPAESVDKAIEISKNNPISVVISDIKMPKKDGFYLLNYMRENNPEVPVILISGFADKELAIKAVKSHAYDFLEKPCDNDEILLACRRAAQQYMLIGQRDYLFRRLEALKEKLDEKEEKKAV